MNGRHLPWALSVEGVPPQCVAVLVGLAGHAGRDGRGAAPSIESLAGYSRKGPRQVKKDLHALVNAGVIRVSDDQSAVEYLRADRRPTVYDLVLNGVAHSSPRGALGEQDPATPRGEPEDTSSETRGEPHDMSSSSPRSERGEPQDTSSPGQMPHGVNPSSPEEEPTVVTSRTSPTSRSGGTRSRGERLPEGWLPSRELVEWARRECPDVDTRREHENFADHWRSEIDSKAKKLDWPATWRKWMRTEQKKIDASKRRSGRSIPRPVSEGFHSGVGLAERLAQEEAEQERLGDQLMIEESA